MKNIWPIFLVLFWSCGGSESTNESSNLDSLTNPLVQYKSDLRPGLVDWDVTEVFTDTVDFVDYNDDADYAFVVIRNSSGKEVSLVTSEFIDRDYLKDGQLILNWKLDSLYEAGEGEALYFQERMISYTAFGDKYDFTIYLKEFIDNYQKYGSVLGAIHEDVEFQTASNPGVYCILTWIPFASTKEAIVNLGTEYKIENRAPKGDFCEGFDEEDGLYFEFIDEDEIREYADLSGDQDVIKTIKPNLSVPYDKIAKVIMIQSGFQDRVFYFFKNDGEWFLWIEDFCDCSA